MTRLAAATAIVLVVGAASPALAERPVLAGEATYDAAGGSLRIHYATTGVDAAPIADGDGDGVPDFVEQVSDIGEAALVQLVAYGFRAPLADGALGGNARTDIYLRNLVSADGNAGIDSCTGNRCIGHITSENDFAGFNYPSITEAIQSVVPHEIFHLIQRAYSSDQSSSWDEGSAVWAVETLYGATNADFERFLPAFLTKSFRPFEREFVGFGDAYPYGAALWPYFLSNRFDTGVVVDTQLGCETAGFLDAANTALAGYGSGLEAAFTEFTRWNLFTGARAAGGAYPDASTWRQVPLETAIEGAGGRIFIEGLSARYAPILVGGELPRVAVSAAAGLQLAGWLVRDGGGLADGIELEDHEGTLAATVEPGRYTLVVTGLTRNKIATEVNVALTPREDPPVTDDDDGGCSAGGSRGTGQAAAILLALAALRFGRGRRR